MPNFTSLQQDQLRVVLGYGSLGNILTTELQEARSQSVIDRALEILDELSRPANSVTGDQGGIDAQLRAARGDSMAQTVGNLKLSYGQHVGHLKSDGSSLLKELANLLGVNLAYNKYRPGSSVSTQSYW